MIRAILICLLLPLCVLSVSVLNNRQAKLTRRGFSLNSYKNWKALPESSQLSGSSLIEYVNQVQDLWQAVPNKFSNVDTSILKGMMGVIRDESKIKEIKSLPVLTKSNIKQDDLPENFDAREHWPNCASIQGVRDQSACGSCWAFGAVEAISDRICIASEGKVQVNISAADLMGCCNDCGYGCNGGYPSAAWRFWKTKGIVSGSDYGSNEGCLPYPFPQCEHHNNHTTYPQCPKSLYDTPQCVKGCAEEFSGEYDLDKYFGKSVYFIDNEEEIKQQLYKNGPLEVDFDVYEDLMLYSKGVYSHQAGSFLGGHAVKLLGWGVEEGVPYWLLANSWNEDWGDKGFFKILRGADECGIESDVIGGDVDLERSKGLNQLKH